MKVYSITGAQARAVLNIINGTETTPILDSSTEPQTADTEAPHEPVIIIVD